MTYPERIVEIANKFLGQQELTGNSGFKDSDFQKRMEAVGWLKTQAWCAYFAELVYKEAYSDQPKVLALLDKLFSGSSTATYKNFDIAEVTTCSKVPVIGALVIYRFGSGWQGHTGIVTRVTSGKVFNIEGNSNDEGLREGVKVVFKSRNILTKYSEKGLNLVGYIHPIEPDKIPETKNPL